MALGGVVLIKALLARILFYSHAFICIAHIHEDQPLTAYLLVIPLVFLLLETYYTLKYSHGGDWKWFCPSVFLFLCSVVPAIWIMERHLQEMYVTKLNQTNTNTSLIRQVENGTENYKQSLIINGIELLPVRLSPRVWANIMEQTLLLILILGRWLLPKAQIGRERLSQLLMEYIGTAADILELNEAFVERKILTNDFLIQLVLLCWTSGVLQFSFVLTSRRKKRTNKILNGLFLTDIWSILLSCIMQDIPFLSLRLYLIIEFDIVSELNVFFASKNTLVLMLQCYRVYSICRESLMENSSKNEGGSRGLSLDMAARA